MNIIFDLDGTLIDSSPSILQTVEMAFDACNIPMKLPLTSELVGPPLGQLLRLLSGTDDEQTLKQLAAAFKQSYDSQGYKATTIFDGVPELLFQLKQQQAQMFIATNKRMVPTRKIIEYFGWDSFFDGVYALDTCEAAENKTQLIDYTLKKHLLDRDRAIYVGDTVPDRMAAHANEINFVMVSWGYEFKVDPGDAYIDSAQELVDYLERFCLERVV